MMDLLDVAAVAPPFVVAELEVVPETGVTLYRVEAVQLYAPGAERVEVTL